MVQYKKFLNQILNMLNGKYPHYYILNYSTENFRIYINDQEYFLSKLPKLNITTDYNTAEWDDNENYYQVCFCRGGVVYQLFPCSLQSDYKRYIQYINESIEAFIYSILGSQART